MQENGSITSPQDVRKPLAVIPNKIIDTTITKNIIQKKGTSTLFSDLTSGETGIDCFGI